MPMEFRSVALFFGTIGVAAALMASYQHWGDCFMSSSTVDVAYGEARPIACSSAEVSLIEGGQTPTIEVTCDHTRRRFIMVGHTKRACGVQIDLVDSWKGGAKGEPRVTLMVRPEE